jgi:phospholipid/cholesterol/gamma-HCH transport system permease protein
LGIISNNSKENQSIFEILLPRGLENILIKTWALVSFSARYFKEAFKPPYEIKEFIRQLFEIGYKSFALIGITGFIIGLTLTLQSVPTLDKFGATSLVPSMVGLAIILEIGPVISALIFAGKIGSGIGAELGSMKVTEQIDAMEVSGTNPFNYLVVTRVTAATLMLPLLVIFADAIALFGGYIAVNFSMEMSLKLFFINALSSVTFADIIPSVLKTFFFGFAIGIVGCYEGFNADRGTESVGIAANTAVVIASLLVILIDMIMVQFKTIVF